MFFRQPQIIAVTINKLSKIFQYKNERIFRINNSFSNKEFMKMSEELNKILLRRTLKNEKIIKPLVWISLSVGCNLTRITRFRDPIKL